MEKFREKKNGSLHVSRKLPTYPSPKPTLTHHNHHHHHHHHFYLYPVKRTKLNIQYTISQKCLQTIELTVIAFTKMNVVINK